MHDVLARDAKIAPVVDGTQIATICLFFFSGFAALIYQVAWMRYLSLFFGSDVYSAAITLASFMCGLCLGSFAAHRKSASTLHPLVVFAVLEILIGIYALVFKTLLNGFDPLFDLVYARHFEAAPVLYNGMRFAIAGVILILPTILMGATLPLIVEHFSRNGSLVGKTSGNFYAINTVGALTGVLIAGFLLIPFFGFETTTRIAVIVNIGIGLGTAVIGIVAAQRSAITIPTKPAASEVATGTAPSPEAKRLRDRVLTTIFFSGLAAMAFEVVATRMLTLSFSATVYSFSIMLCCFLLGIAYGSRKAAMIADEHANPARLLSILEIGLGFFILITALVSQIIPGPFGALLWTLVGITGDNFAFASIAATAFVSLLLLSVPTALLGATFPLAVRAWSPDPAKAGYGSGGIYAANTLGAVVGALLGGFVAIPLLGMRGSFIAIAVVHLVCGFYLLQVSADKGRTGFIPIGIAAACLAGVLLILPDRLIANYQMQSLEAPQTIYRGEGVAHTVDIVRNSLGNTVMLVDGNVEADTSYTQRRHFILKAHLPLLLHSKPDSVMVVGLGLGVTLGATTRHPTVKQIRLIELSPEMVEAQQYLKDVSGDVLANPKLSLRIDDARNFLARSDETFDMITADPIHPRITGVGYLYSKEYYASIKQHLNEDGIACQWMPMYNVSKRSFDVAFRTFAETFPNATFWYVRGHGLFVARVSNKPIDFKALAQTFDHPAVKSDMASIDIPSPEQMIGHMLFGPREIAKYLAEQPLAGTVNTDDNAWLEHHTPFEFLHPTRTIIEGLLPYANFDAALFVGATSEQISAMQTAWEQRRKRLLPELDEPIR